MTGIANTVSTTTNADYFSRRHEDDACEKNLQKHFNTVYKALGIKFDRTPEKFLQRQGCDLVMHTRNKSFIVDEKAASRYIDYDLRTFTFELSFKWRSKKGEWQETEGWFHDENKKIKTQYYALGYIRAPYENDNFNKIDRFEVVLISKERLWNYIRSLGYESANSLIQRFKLTPQTSYNGRYYVQLKGGMKLVYTSFYEESPLNLQIRKETLLNLASAIVVIEEGKTKIIRGFAS